jgi:hypothetical protein
MKRLLLAAVIMGAAVLMVLPIIGSVNPTVNTSCAKSALVADGWPHPTSDFVLTADGWPHPLSSVLTADGWPHPLSSVLTADGWPHPTPGRLAGSELA